MQTTSGTVQSKSWRRRIHGEPSLSALINDPLTHLVMHRDGVSPIALRLVIRQAQRALGHREITDCACLKAA